MIDTELFKKSLLQGPIPSLVEEDNYVTRRFDKFYIHDYENIIQNYEIIISYIYIKLLYVFQSLVHIYVLYLKILNHYETIY